MKDTLAAITMILIMLLGIFALGAIFVNDVKTCRSLGFSWVYCLRHR